MAPASASMKKNFRTESKLEVFYTGGRVAFSRDGCFAVCPCSEEAKVVDLATGAIRHTFPGDTELVTAVAIGPEGVNVFVASRSLQVKWWLLSTGEVQRSWKAHDGLVAAMAVDSSGGLLATASTDRSVRVWDVERGYCTHSFRGHDAIVTRVLFHPDAHRLQLFSASDDSVVRVWDLVTKNCVAALKKHFSPVAGLAVSTDGWTLVTAGRDKVVNLWDLRNNSLLATVPVYESLEAVCVLPPGSPLPGAPPPTAGLPKRLKKGLGTLRFLTAGERGVLRAWNAETGKCLYEQKLPTGTALTRASKLGGGEEEAGHREEDSGGALGVLDVVLRGSGGEAGVVTVTGDQRLVLYRPAGGEEDGASVASTVASDLQVDRELVGYNDEVIDLRFVGAGGEQLAVATNSEQIRIYDMATLSCARSLIGHTDIVLALDVRPGTGGDVAPILASAGKDHSVRVWDITSGRCLAMAVGHTAAVGAIAFSRRSASFLVSGASDRTLKVWNLEKALDKASKAVVGAGTGGQVPPVTLKSLAVVAAHDKDINSVAVAPNDTLACTGSQDRTACVWRLPELTPVLTLRGHKKGVWSVDFSPVDQAVLTASGDKTIRVWSLSDGSCLKTFEGHTASVLRASFLTRGTQIVSAGADGLIKLWTIRTSECVGSFDGHEDKVWALAVSPQEDRLASGGGDSVVNVWQDTTAADEEEEAKKAEQELLLDQDLDNALADTDWGRAVQLAFELRRPFRMLKVFEEMLREERGAALARGIVEELEGEQLKVLLSYIREWNSNSRFCHTAQAVLAVTFATHPLPTLVKVPQIRQLVEGLLPYSQRHLSRLDRLVRSTYLLDYTLATMSVLMPTSDADLENQISSDGLAEVEKGGRDEVEGEGLEEEDVGIEGGETAEVPETVGEFGTRSVGHVGSSEAGDVGPNSQNGTGFHSGGFTGRSQIERGMELDGGAVEESKDGDGGGKRGAERGDVAAADTGNNEEVLSHERNGRSRKEEYRAEADTGVIPGSKTKGGKKGATKVAARAGEKGATKVARTGQGDQRHGTDESERGGRDSGYEAGNQERVMRRKRKGDASAEEKEAQSKGAVQLSNCRVGKKLTQRPHEVSVEDLPQDFVEVVVEANNGHKCEARVRTVDRRQGTPTAQVGATSIRKCTKGRSKATSNKPERPPLGPQRRTR